MTRGSLFCLGFVLLWLWASFPERADLDELYRHADSLFNAGKYPEAKAELTKVITTDSAHVNAHWRLALVYDFEQKYDSAVTCYERVISLAPNFVLGYNYFGLLYKQKGEHEKALVVFQKAITADSLDPGAYYNIARVYGSQHKMKDALSWLRRAFNKGFKDLKMVGSDSDLDALRENPEFALLVKETTKKVKAEQLRQQAVKARNEDNYGEALSLFNDELKLRIETGDRRGEASALYEISLIYFGLEKYDEALKYSKQAFVLCHELDDNETSIVVLEILGNICGNLERYEDAVAYYEDALKIRRETGAVDNIEYLLLCLAEAYGKIGKSDEALRYHSDYLEIINRKIVVSRADSLSNKAQDAFANNDYGIALSFLNEELELRKTITDRRGEEEALRKIGLVSVLINKCDVAKNNFKQAIIIAEEIDDQAGIVSCLSGIGFACEKIGNFSEALDYYEQALALAGKTGDQASIAKQLYDTGRMHHSLGNYKEASSRFHKAINIYIENGDQESESMMYVDLALAYQQEDEYDDAIIYFEKALAAAKEFRGQAEDIAVLLRSLAESYSAIKKYQESLDYFNEALSIYQESKDHRNEGIVLLEIGLTYYHWNENEKAVECGKQALDKLKNFGERAEIVLALSLLGDASNSLCAYSNALEYYSKVLEICRKTKDPENEALILLKLGSVYANMNQNEKALNYLKKSLKLYQDIHDNNGEGNALLFIGEFMHNDLKKQNEAIEHLVKAMDIFHVAQNQQGEIEAIEMLSEIGGEQVLIVLVKKTVDEDAEVSGKACFVLSQKGTDVIVPNLIAMLEKAGDEQKEGIIYLLGDLHSSQANQVLLELLKNENLYFIAAHAFKAIADPSAIMPLMNMLQDTDMTARKGAAYALGEIREKSAVPVLIEMLKNDSAEVRGFAARALGKIGDSQAVLALIDAVENITEDAIYALGEIRDSRAVPVLIDALRKKPFPFCSEAAKALGKIGDSRAAVPLMNVLKDKDSYTRTDIAEALGKLGDKQAVLPLIAMLNDALQQDYDSTLGITDRGLEGYAAIKALGEIGDKQALRALIEALKDPDKEVREYAIAALGNLGDGQAILPIINTVTSDNAKGTMRYSAIEALGKIGGGDAIALLTRVINHSNPDVRVFAASALGKLGNKMVIPALIEALKDSNENVRSAVVYALSDIGVGETVSPLTAALRDKSSQVRMDVAQALGYCKDKKVIPFLIDALKDSIAGVCVNAALALGRMAAREAIPRLIDILDEQPNAYVSENIIDGIKQMGDYSHVPLLEEEAEKFDPTTKVEALLLAAWFCNEAGQFLKELELCKKAYENAVKSNNFYHQFIALQQISTVQIKLSQPADAFDRIRQASAIIPHLSQEEKIKIGLPEIAISCLTGECYYALGRSREAVDIFKDALLKIDARLNLWSERLGAWDWRWNKTLFEKMKARLLVGQGDAMKEESQRSYGESIKIYDNYTPEDRTEKETCEKAYNGMIGLLIADGDYEGAQKYIEKALSKKISELFNRTDPTVADPEKRKELERGRGIQKEIEQIKKKLEELARNKPAADDKKAQEKADDLKLLHEQKNQEYKNFIYELKKNEPELASIIGSEPGDLKHLQTCLPESTAIIQYLIGEDKLYIFVVKQQGIYAEGFDLPKQVLEEKIKNLLASIYTSSGIIVQQARTMPEDEFQENFTGQMEQALGELYMYLVEPIKFELGSIKHLGIVPNGILHYLPFSMLIYHDSDQHPHYLIEKYEITYLNSTTHLYYAILKDKCEIGETRLIAFGNADGTLKYAEMEVGELEHLLPNASVYTRENATKDRAKQPLGECAILHFATHSILNSRDATASHIVLAPQGEQGWLSVKETWGMDLNSCQLVTLSACQTARGELIAGDEIINLAEAFIFAGTPSVMATLWQVDDEMTTALMKEFYTQLMNGKTKSESLRKAQLSIINNNKNLAHPFFWAPFILIGDWR